MNESRWARSGAVAGFLTVALLVAAVATGGPPKTGDSFTKIVNFYSDNRSRILISGLLALLGSVAFLWFLVQLRRLVALAGERDTGLATGLLASGIAVAAVGSVNSLPQVALAGIVHRPGMHLDESLVRGLVAFSAVFYGPLSMFIALFTALLAIAAVLGRIGPRWLSWIAALSAVTAFIGACSAFFPAASGKPSAVGVLGLIGTLLGLLAILIASIGMLSPASTSLDQHQA